MTDVTCEQPKVDSESETINESIIARFRDAKTESERELEESGKEAGVRFVDTTAEYGELRRLERWWERTRDNPDLDLEAFGPSGLADILAGEHGDGKEIHSHLQELGGADSDDGRWIEGFITGALRRFEQIEAKL